MKKLTCGPGRPAGSRFATKMPAFTMRLILLILAFALSVVGCAAQTVAPSDLGPILVESEGEAVPVTDKRSANSKKTQWVEEHLTTTVLVGDDLLFPLGPRLMGQRLKRTGSRCLESAKVALSIFIVSIEGRNGGPSVFLPFWPHQPSLSAGQNFAADLLLTAFLLVRADAPRSFTPDLLRVSIDGEVSGLRFSAKESARLHGKVTVREVSALISQIADEASVAALHAVSAGNSGDCGPAK